MAYATRAPGRLPQIDWSNPLTRGLVAAYVPGAGGQGQNIANVAATRDNLTGLSASVITQGPNGQGLASTAANMGALGTSSAALKNQTTAGFVLYDKTGASNAGNNDRLLTVDYQDDGGGFFVCYGLIWEGTTLNLSGNNSSGYQNPAGYAWTPTALRPNALGFNYGAASVSTIYVDGVGVASGTPAAGAIGYTATSRTILNKHTSTTDYTGMSALMAAIWNRTLTAGEHRALARNPWQIFKAPPSVASRSLLGGSSASTPIAFAGTAPATFGQTGALTAAQIVSGAAAATFAQTALFTAPLFWAGAAPTTFAATVTMTAPYLSPWTPVVGTTVRYGFPMFLMSNQGAVNLWTPQGASSGAWTPII
jgi:hypothetical protein